MLDRLGADRARDVALVYHTRRWSVRRSMPTRHSS